MGLISSLTLAPFGSIVLENPDPKAGRKEILK